MTVSDYNNFSCLIIGTGSLPIRCAEILLKCGNEIYGIVSSDPEVKKWSDKNAITCYEPGLNLAVDIEKDFDYLFSIVNEHILNDDMLQLPRKMAINYHDAPLPRYAGTHATSWAIMNGETDYAVSWHEISNVVDAGDILNQSTVDISADDTALTLNTKCFEAAVSAFEELIDGLARGKVVPTKQDLDKTHFFSSIQKAGERRTHLMDV